jgi:hypothetical protein
MGIEVSTYISGLTASWPPSGDPKSQGDDHLRLIKGVLQSTFPTASKAYYFPKGEAASTTTVLDATDQNNVLFMTTTGGDVAVTLPTGLVSADAGWSCEIMKVSVDTNGVMVSPTSGQIISQVGPTNTIRVGAYCQPARFTWTGASWICSKPGAMIGTAVNFDGAGIPRGYLAFDGSAYNTTTFAELFMALGSATLVDKRGRAEIGAGTGSGLTARTLGTGYGVETQSLVSGHLPAITSSGSNSITVYASGSSNYYLPTSFNATWGNDVVAGVGSSGSFTIPYTTNGILGSANSFSANNGISVTAIGTSGGANGAAFGLLQPSIATQKLIRAC